MNFFDDVRIYDWMTLTEIKKYVKDIPKIMDRHTDHTKYKLINVSELDWYDSHKMSYAITRVGAELGYEYLYLAYDSSGYPVGVIAVDYHRSPKAFYFFDFDYSRRHVNVYRYYRDDRALTGVYPIMHRAVRDRHSSEYVLLESIYFQHMNGINIIAKEWYGYKKGTDLND